MADYASGYGQMAEGAMAPVTWYTKLREQLATEPLRREQLALAVQKEREGMPLELAAARQQLQLRPQQVQAQLDANRLAHLLRQDALAESIRHHQATEAQGVRSLIATLDERRRKAEEPHYDPERGWVFRPNTAGQALIVPVPQAQSKLSSRAHQIRTEMTKALEPLDKTEQDITEIQQLLQTGNPATHRQIQAKLTDLFERGRATNMLFKDNRNFGDLYQRFEGGLSRYFGGTYSNGQQAMIQRMVNEMRANVLQPTRARIQAHFSGLGAAGGVPEHLIRTPNFYGSPPEERAVPRSTAVQEMENYFKNKGLR